MIACKGNTDMKANLKNWQTTLAGALFAALVAVQEISAGKDVTDWKTWILPASIAFLGYLARDAGRSTEESK